MGRSKARYGGLRLTKVGFWFLLFALVIALGATNTGNNGLYLVLALMGATFVVAEGIGRSNLRHLVVTLEPPSEAFAQQVFPLAVRVENPSRMLPRFLLVVAVDAADIESDEQTSEEREAASSEPMVADTRRRIAALLLPRLGRRATHDGHLDLMMQRRGRRRITVLHLKSLFPLGFFYKSFRHPVDLELLIFPEIFAPPGSQPDQAARQGEETSRQPGWGHDLRSLRTFRSGDDPRGIHWKQSARTGRLIFKERQSESNRRLSVVFDNAVGPLPDATSRRRFERLVSEAATAALDYLERGFEVELVCRDEVVPFGTGQRQRRAILETLALVEPSSASSLPLEATDAQAPHLRLAMAERAGSTSGSTMVAGSQEVAGSQGVAV